MAAKRFELENIVDDEELAYKAGYKFIVENMDYNSKAYEMMLSNLVGRRRT